MSRFKTLAALILPPLWNNRVLPALDLPLRGRTAANLVFATGYTKAFQGTPNWLSASGFRWGSASAAIVLTGYAIALSIPPLRRIPLEIETRTPETSTLEWTALHIPLGTVLAEEAIFRGTLDPLLTRSLGTPALSPLDFGLWHIHPARTANDSIPATILATTLAGLLFTELRRRSNSATAPALLHLALNTGAALTPLAARRIEQFRK
ncbi:CPBP family intramembrane glutamic endopeptidase [Nocardia sp. NPDC058666]|uniref:CPBP family intramembrane glutamic endopeptidase n=1 Tax=Nocardia sp. NPDC058666 TaxID=3346587 RepID=UPI00364832A3